MKFIFVLVKILTVITTTSSLQVVDRGKVNNDNPSGHHYILNHGLRSARKFNRKRHHLHSVRTILPNLGNGYPIKNAIQRKKNKREKSFQHHLRNVVKQAEETKSFGSQKDIVAREVTGEQNVQESDTQLVNVEAVPHQEPILTNEELTEDNDQERERSETLVEDELLALLDDQHEQETQLVREETVPQERIKTKEEITEEDHDSETPADIIRGTDGNCYWKTRTNFFVKLDNEDCDTHQRERSGAVDWTSCFEECLDSVALNVREALAMALIDEKQNNKRTGLGMTVLKYTGYAVVFGALVTATVFTGGIAAIVTTSLVGVFGPAISDAANEKYESYVKKGKQNKIMEEIQKSPVNDLPADWQNYLKGSQDNLRLPCSLCCLSAEMDSQKDSSVCTKFEVGKKMDPDEVMAIDGHLLELVTDAGGDEATFGAFLKALEDDILGHKLNKIDVTQ